MKDEPENELEIKKNMTTILSELNTIASYSDSKNYNLDKFTKSMDALFQLMTSEKEKGRWNLSPRAIEHVCNVTNSARFDFTKKGFKIVLPEIRNLNLGYNVNE